MIRWVSRFEDTKHSILTYNLEFFGSLLDKGLEGDPGGVLQTHVVLGDGQHLHKVVVLFNPLLDTLLDTGLEFVTAEEINSN